MNDASQFPVTLGDEILVEPESLSAKADQRA
jgi:hypothetical protein